MPGGASDAVRVIPSLAAGASVVQYFFVTYPLVDSLNRAVTGAASVPGDDLWLEYDIWAYANDGVTTRRVDKRTRATMRNEISAMANKILPNGDNKVPNEYLDVIESALGWRPSTGVPRIPGASVSEGIWYDLGNVGAGFDNNGDGIPDRNAWLQPVGDPSKFSPLAARMVKCYGLVIVKLNDGTERLIPFEDQLYFENIVANNTGAVGLVFYEFLTLNSSLPSSLTPYQEVASGYDNEKFNSDYVLLSSVPPLRHHSASRKLVLRVQLQTAWSSMPSPPPIPVLLCWAILCSVFRRLSKTRFLPILPTSRGPPRQTTPCPSGLLLPSLGP